MRAANSPERNAQAGLEMTFLDRTFLDRNSTTSTPSKREVIVGRRSATGRFEAPLC